MEQSRLRSRGTFSALLFCLAAVLHANARAAVLPTVSVHSNCTPAATTVAHTYYVDPAAKQGDGSAGRPFPSLAEAIATARGGDLIALGSGDYGVAAINGANANFITIAAGPGQTPVFGGLKIGGFRPASHWRFVGLTVSGFGAGGLNGSHWQNHEAKVIIRNSDNIVFDHNTIDTAPGDYPWKAEIQGVDAPNPLASGLLADNNHCIAVVENNIFNVFNGIQIGGDQKGENGMYILLEGNKIDHFAGDGIDHFGSHVVIHGNRITNGIDFCKSECIHNDGIQGWNHNGQAGITNVDVLIDGNTIIQQTIPNLPFSADDLHGITIFDGDWDGVRIVNNVVITYSWHGISLYGARNSAIVNNTVLSPIPSRSAWILVNNKKNTVSNTPANTIVTNNIASKVVNGQPGKTVPGVTIERNLLTSDPRRVFVKFDTNEKSYDVHLRKDSPARGVGKADPAADHDLDGKPRSGKVDAGAYAPGA